MTADLAGFLLAQLDADKADARNKHRDTCSIFRRTGDAHCDCGYPAFELDRIAALRVVVEGFTKWRRMALDDPDSLIAALRYDAWVTVLLALAQPYRGRPGWRDEWGTG